MNLYRFTAPDNQKVIAKVQEALGPDALIYSIRRNADGIEALAGVDESSEEAAPPDVVGIKDTFQDGMLYQSITAQIQKLHDNISFLIEKANNLEQLIDKKKQKRPSFFFNPFRIIFRIFRHDKKLKAGAYGRG